MYILSFGCNIPSHPVQAKQTNKNTVTLSVSSLDVCAAPRPPLGSQRGRMPNWRPAGCQTCKTAHGKSELVCQVSTLQTG